MVKTLHFVKKSETRKYKIQNIEFKLKLNIHVFPPSPHGIFFAKNISIKKNESVIDIGTGSGFLAILAAKLGGKVFATDTDKFSFFTAKQNAKFNDVDIKIKQGKFFTGFGKKSLMLL